MIKIFFENHRGMLETDSHNVTFYGLYFNTMTEAIGFLKMIEPGEHYGPWYAKGVRGVIDESTGRVFAKGVWWHDEEMAIKAVCQEDE
jgi:hypothetical protein